MNYFSLAGVLVALKPPVNYLRAVALGQLFGQNKDFFTDTGQGFKFKLPFALTNISVTGLTNTLYDSAVQGVNEFSDRPFAMKGLIVVLSTLTTDTDWQKDVDNYRSWEISVDSGGTPVLYTIAIGVLNSTLTESYTPLSSVDQAVYYDSPLKSNNAAVVTMLPPNISDDGVYSIVNQGASSLTEAVGVAYSGNSFASSPLQRLLN